MSFINENIIIIKSKIAEAAKRSGRCENDITLICATKTRTVEEIKEVLETGVFQLGENRAQEFMEKYGKVQDIAESMNIERNIMWNFIGHLQKNKIKYIAGRVALIQSVDSIKLAEEIDVRYAKIDESAKVLIQLNTADEAQKSGVAMADLEALVDEIDERLPFVKICGLMAVVPIVEDPGEVRKYFREAKKMFDKLSAKRGGAENGFEHLSMGMTHDYEVAIEEGATMVRVGTAIFGSRN